MARDAAVGDAHISDDALVGVVGGIEHQGAEGIRGAPIGRRHALHDGVQQFPAAQAVFSRNEHNLITAEAEDLLQFGGDPLRLGGGQIDLVDDGDHLQVVLQGQQGVGDGLRLHALSGVHHQ